MLSSRLQLEILPQPTPTSCGPTCLHSVYRYYGDEISLARVIQEAGSLKSGGTLAVLLACHALERGYHATIYTYNLEVFDPTWFDAEGGVSAELSKKLRQRLKAKKGKRLKIEIKAYLRFIELGGVIRFQDLTQKLIVEHLHQGRPLLTGLSATYLYRTPREYGRKFIDDDVRGEPSGHFVVLSGYDPKEREVAVADPLDPNPPFDRHYYTVQMDRLICAIMLGILTYDANVLVVTPGAGTPTTGESA